MERYIKALRELARFVEHLIGNGGLGKIPVKTVILLGFLLLLAGALAS